MAENEKDTASSPYAEPETQTPYKDSDQSVTWTASEFIHHHKSAGWYFMLLLATVMLAALIYLFTRDVVSPLVVIVAGVLIGIYGSHQPDQLQYRLDKKGVTVGQKYYGYHEFRSFSLAPEGAFTSIVFMPLKRFALPTTIYFAPEDEEKIINILSEQLPLEQHQPDAIDRLMRSIRF